MYLKCSHFKLFLSLSILASLTFSMVAGQNSIEKTARELSLNLDKSSQKKVDKVNNLMVDAEKLLEQAISSNEKERSTAEIKQSMDKCLAAAEIMKGLYESVVEDFYKKSNRIYINKFDHARYYDQKADGYMSTAKRMLQKRDSVSELKDFQQYSANAFDAYSFAMIDQMRAMKIYQDFPIEYPYEWDDFFKQHQIILAREEAAKVKANVEYKAEKEQVVKESFKMIYFRVQIAAHTAPIPESQLKPMYAGKVPIQEFKDGDWYKYTIGNFERYEQALDLLKTCGVRKAFIVAYDSQNVRQDLKSVIKDKK
jgi:hypothetical protein